MLSRWIIHNNICFEVILYAEHNISSHSLNFSCGVFIRDHPIRGYKTSEEFIKELFSRWLALVTVPGEWDHELEGT